MNFSNAQFLLLSIILFIDLTHASAISMRILAKSINLTDKIRRSPLQAIPLPNKAYIKVSQNENEAQINNKSNNIPALNLQNLLDTSTTSSNQSIAIMHSPNIQSTTPIMRMWGIALIIIFSLVNLLIRYGSTSLKYFNLFYLKGLISLSNQIVLLFICFDILFCCFVYGCFDSVLINWEYLLCSIALFILGWIIFCFLILLLSLTIIKKWELSERLAQSFSFLKKIYYEQPNQRREILDAFEFLILKRYFYVPLFPILKPSSLRKEMKFNLYLQYCLTEQLRLFFKISWFSWITLIVTIMNWYVFIIPLRIYTVTIIIMMSPLLEIFACLGIYSYTRIVYRRIIVQVNNDTILEFRDYDYESNDMFQSLVYPIYLKKIIDQEGEMEKEYHNTYTCFE